LLVQDSAYLLTVPALCADVPHLPRDPVIAYLADDFQRPYPFEPSVVVDVSTVWDQKIRLLHAHASQFYEWLPYNRNYADQVPENDQDRLDWLSRDMAARARRQADRLRPVIVSAYGVDRGETMHRVEAFEGCEYGAPLDLDAIRRLFPFATPCRASS
jgi:LmbE family N-acetylglucosaminyl deacetylase